MVDTNAPRKKPVHRLLIDFPDEEALLLLRRIRALVNREGGSVKSQSFILRRYLERVVDEAGIPRDL